MRAWLPETPRPIRMTATTRQAAAASAMRQSTVTIHTVVTRTTTIPDTRSGMAWPRNSSSRSTSSDSVRWISPERRPVTVPSGTRPSRCPTVSRSRYIVPKAARCETTIDSAMNRY